MHFHSPVGNENKGVDAVEPASSDSPPDCRILDLRIRPPAIQTHKKTNPERIGLFVVGEDGFDPSKRNAADLQSVPLGHSGTPPDMRSCLKDLIIIARISDLSRGKMKVFWEMKNEALLTQYDIRLRRMIYLLRKHDIISVPIIREAYIIRVSGYHRVSDIIRFRRERISLKKS